MSADSFPDKINALIALLSDTNWAIQEHATRELLLYGASAVPALVSAFADEGTWYGAAETLARLGVPAVEPLITCLGNPRLDNFAVHALTRRGAPAVLPLVNALPQAKVGSEARDWIRLLLEWLSDPKENLDPALRARATSALAQDSQPQ